jgi:hypothetical protein
MNNHTEQSYNKIVKDYDTSNILFTSMKPTYSTNIELYCGVIEYNNKTYLFDNNDKDKIINFDKKFIFVSEKDIYPSYAANYRRYNYLDFIYNLSTSEMKYHFKNGNQYDLRRCNVEIHHNYQHIIDDKYNIIEYIPGHYSMLGTAANKMKNPIWRIIENDKEYLLMYCEKDTICKLCSQSYQKLLDYEKVIDKKLSWYNNNGYIMTHISSGKLLYIHQIIMDCYGNGKGTKIISVDHIDQDPLNNSLENLRIATRKEQEDNSKGIKEGTKRERKYNAIKLPDGITQSMMRKYVVYYHEWLNKEHTKEREFFKVEKHPKLDKEWCTTKSGKVSIRDKLDQANKIVDDLDEDIYPEKNEPILPKYVSLGSFKEKFNLIYEKKIEGKRLNLKMVLPEKYDLEAEISRLNEKIITKYGEEFKIL